MITIGSLYADSVQYPFKKLFPLFERGWTQEIDEPFRRGSCIVFRVPFTRLGLVIGLWKETLGDETIALSTAINAREISLKDADFETL